MGCLLSIKARNVLLQNSCVIKAHNVFKALRLWKAKLNSTASVPINILLTHIYKTKTINQPKSHCWVNFMIIIYRLTSTENGNFCVLWKYLRFSAKESKKPAKPQLCVRNHQREGLKSRNHHSKELLNSLASISTVSYSTGLLSCHRVSKLPLPDHKVRD